MGYGRAYEGIGLGLALVKKVLDLNNSKLVLKVKKAKGQHFL
jgi:K+-sensing histidine kinase KdpD